MSTGAEEFPGVEASRVREAYSRRASEREWLLYSYFNPAFLYHMQERERKSLALLKQKQIDLSTAKVLELGCEKGRFLLDLLRWGVCPANLWGVDILAEHVTEAMRVSPSAVRLNVQNAAQMEFADASFDVVSQGTVFSSILDAEVRRAAAKEMLRVLRPKGAILWYDFSFDNPRNEDVCGLGLREILSLFPECRVMARRITLAPPLARLIAPRSRLLFEILTFLRFLNTHFVALITRT